MRFLFNIKGAGVIVFETSMGEVKIELDFERTPNTAGNFEEYVRNGHYDGTVFHRVIDGFMIQGGGFDADMNQKETREPIDNEADLGGSNALGSVAMARTGDPHSASAQFFINVKDNTFLDFTSKTQEGWGYCVFGHVAAGMDVVEKIKAVSTGSFAGHQDVPVEPVIVTKAYVEGE